MLDYIKFRHQKTRKMPIYRAKVDGKYQYAYTDDELAKLTEKINGEEQDTEVLEIFEAQDIEEVVTKIEKLDIDLSTYAVVEDPKTASGSVDPNKKAKALYRIVNEDKEHTECACLKEVLDFIKSMATKGMHIQRYKGLGEMNPHQLWETTMDPEKRTILQVTLEDAVEVDKMFTVLMGDQVEPRRQFIEEYAHQVKNLDV